MVLQPVDDASQAGFILDERGDVVEENAGLGKVGHLADERLEICHVEIETGETGETVLSHAAE